MQLTGILCVWFLLSSASFSFERRRVRVGVDYGPRLIGVAYTDLFGQAHTIQTLRNDGKLVDISNKILEKAHNLGAAEIVVGIPSDLDGTIRHEIRNFNGQLCLNFSTVLCTLANVQHDGRIGVRLFDERYTTKEAKLKLLMDKRKASLDAMSAACLLERYLECEGEGSLPALSSSYPLPDHLAFFNYDIVKEFIKNKYYEDIAEEHMSDGLARALRRARQPIEEGGGEGEDGEDEQDEETTRLLALREQRRKAKGMVKRKPSL